MIEVRNLVREYDGKTALAGVSFVAKPGEATGYLGPNGAGKSTTVRILTGLLRPTSGEAIVAGFDVSRDPLEVKRRVGYVPESAALYDSLTSHEYLSLVAELHEVPRKTAADRIERLTAAFRFADVVGRPIESLSKGNRQKVLISSALLHEPEVLVFDEPLDGLDVNAALAFRELIAEMLQQGRTVLFCSHILDVVERLCTKVVVIDGGRIVADEPTAALLARTKSGTLEGAFRQLTKREDADDAVKALLDAFGGGRPAQGSAAAP